MDLAHIERFFDSSHLPEELAKFSRKFEALKNELLNDVDADTPFVKEGLLKLIEAKNNFVQVAILMREQAEHAVSVVTTVE